MTRNAKLCFLLGAAGSASAGLLHIWAILAGPAAYAALGAPPEIIQSAQAGTLYAPLITLCIACILFGWAAYALSAIKWLPRLLWLRLGLAAIAGVLLLRAAAFIPLLFLHTQPITSFAIWSSALCFLLGSIYALGLIFGWQALRP